MTLHIARSIHPGEVLREEFLVPLGLTPYALAKVIRVPRTRVERLAAEKTSVTSDTALRLARYFRTSPAFWVNLQSLYDLHTAEKEIGEELAEIEPRAAIAA